VGVFTNEPLDRAIVTAGRLGRLTTIQWHGDEHEPWDAFPFRYVPAFSVRDRDGLAAIERFLARAREGDRLPAAVLIDGHRAGLYGGTGQAAPWELLSDFRPGVPVILAGGLTPENVAEAVRIVRPYAVDVASGVESSPGRKGPDKVERFIANAWSAR
jgi:phosphoribosylanthranilate isomerase